MIGLDASAAAMAEMSRRAARPRSKGGLPNLLFAVSAAECPPHDLCGRVDEVTVLFPWGSLLRGLLALDPAAAGGLAALLAPAGIVRALVSIADRDRAATDLRPLSAADRDDLARRWAKFGLSVVAFTPASDEEVLASGSSWGRRLRAGERARSRDSITDRAVWRIELRHQTPRVSIGRSDDPR